MLNIVKSKQNIIIKTLKFWYFLYMLQASGICALSYVIGVF